MAGDEVKRFGTHDNAFGFLRLLFASLVIVSHTPEMIDGNRSREILTRIFGTISFGELAVDCFFLVSGYLIVGSYLKQPVAWHFLLKRIARIYPAFIVASAVAVLIVAPLAGAQLHRGDLIEAARRVVILREPDIAGVFPGTSYPVLNGAMWTIAYEFRCYLLVLMLGLLGALRSPWVSAALALVATVIARSSLVGPLADLARHLPKSGLVLGEVSVLVRLCPIFLIGSVYYLAREHIRYSRAGALVAAALLLVSLSIGTLAEPGLAIFGGYLIFGLAQWGGGTVLARINNRNDISYGLYLYAWPIEKLLLFYHPGLTPLSAGILTWLGAAAAGFVSWHALEKPALAVLTRPRRPPPPA